MVAPCTGRSCQLPGCLNGWHLPGLQRVRSAPGSPWANAGGPRYLQVDGVRHLQRDREAAIMAVCPVCESDLVPIESGPNNALYLPLHGTDVAACQGSGLPLNKRWHK